MIFHCHGKLSSPFSRDGDLAWLWCHLCWNSSVWPMILLHCLSLCLLNIMHESMSNMFLQLKTWCLFCLGFGSIKEVVCVVTLSACRIVPSKHLQLLAYNKLDMWEEASVIRSSYEIDPNYWISRENRLELLCFESHRCTLWSASPLLQINRASGRGSCLGEVGKQRLMMLTLCRGWRTKINHSARQTTLLSLFAAYLRCEITLITSV